MIVRLLSVTVALPTKSPATSGGGWQSSSSGLDAKVSRGPWRISVCGYRYSSASGSGSCSHWRSLSHPNRRFRGHVPVFTGVSGIASRSSSADDLLECARPT